MASRTYQVGGVHAAITSILKADMVAMEHVHRRLYDAPARRHCLLAPLHDHREILLVEVLALVEL